MSPAPRFRAVVFDLFGTLIPNIPEDAWARRNAEISAILGADEHAFASAWRETHKSRMDGSLPDDDNVFAAVLAKAGGSAGADALARAAAHRTGFLQSCIQPKHDAVACLQALEDGGLRLALATDCSSGTPALLDSTALGAFFPIRAASALVGVTKPHPRMYRHVLDGLGLKGRDCLYVGDGNSRELPGAQEYGFTTVWVDNGANQHFRLEFVPEADYTIRELSEVPRLALGP